jgi:proteasome lid subunit RPN8/RPN11
VSARVLHLDPELAEVVLEAAARAFPQECCGLIEGIETAEGWRVLAVHQATNVAEDPARNFLIDPQAQFKLLRGLRGSGRRVIGCFHSHPGGAPRPSATDRVSAAQSDFLWLIAGGSPETGFMLGAYLFSEDSGFCALVLRNDAPAPVGRLSPASR